jgi:hypothetical protein
MPEGTTMEISRTTKFCAALVLITWLATAVSSWGFRVAAAEATAEDERCSIADLQNRSLRVEMASGPATAVLALNADPVKAPCIRRGIAANVRADYLFIPAYGAFNFALLLFVGALRRRLPLFLLLGALLSPAMVVADVVENLHLREIVELAGISPPPLERIVPELPGLRAATAVKLGALALSAAVAGALWPAKPGSVLVWVPRFLGVAAAAVFAYGLIRRQWPVLACGMEVVALFWLAGLVHAVAVAVGPEAPAERRRA